jgi:hypothetical protein
MNYLSLTEYAELSERIQRIFDLAGDAARSKGLFVSNPTYGGLETKSVPLCDPCTTKVQFLEILLRFSRTILSNLF